jgi:hypothetical protein
MGCALQLSFELLTEHIEKFFHVALFFDIDEATIQILKRRVRGMYMCVCALVRINSLQIHKKNEITHTHSLLPHLSLSRFLRDVILTLKLRQNEEGS